MANEDPQYLVWLRQMSCRRCRARGPSQAHHKMGAGMAMRSHDDTAIPLCRSCHEDAHGFKGLFKVWSRERMHEWHDMEAEKMRELYAAFGKETWF